MRDLFDKDDGMIRSYLLGGLSDSEQETIEQRLLTEKAFFTRFLIIEETLTDEYARGFLDNQERRQFETRFMKAPERRESVGFAKAFNRYISEETAHGQVGSLAAGEVIIRQNLSRPNPASTYRAFVAAVLLCVLLIAGGAWLFVENSTLRDQIAAERIYLREREERLQQEIEKQRTDNSELSTELVDARTSLTSLEEELASLKKLDKPDTPPKTISLILTAGLTRGADQSQRIYLTRDAGRLRLELKLEGEIRNLYQVDLRTVEGDEVWKQSNLKARQLRAGNILVATVPAGQLKENDYIVRLSRLLGKSYETIGTYYFAVLRSN